MATRGGHARYLRERFPRLRAAARVDDDVSDLTGHLIAMLDAWRVEAKTGMG